MLLDKTAFVSILQDSASSSSFEAYTAHSGFGSAAARSSAVKVNIQPASAEKVVMYDGMPGKTYNAFTRASGILEGMMLTVSGTNQRYIVRGREVFDYGVDQHYELILNKAELQ